MELKRSELEQDLLISLLAVPGEMDKIARMVQPTWFSSLRWRTIYEAMLAVHARGLTVEPYAITAELARRNMLQEVGEYWDLEISAVDRIVLHVPTHYAALLREQAMREQAMRNAQRLAQASSSASAEELRRLYQEMLAGQITDSPPQAASLDYLLALYSERYRQGTPAIPHVVQTGIKALDTALNYLAPGNTYVLAARPGVGKSSLALSIAHNVARAEQTVLYFSLEMDALDLALRALSPYVMLPAARLRRMDIPDPQRLEEAIAQARTPHLLLDDTPYPNVLALSAASHQIAQLHPLRLVVVDYVQLLGPVKASNRREIVIETSQGLKRLSQELSVPVLAVAQLSRAAEHEEEPDLHHLAESSALEADASAVVLMWRKEQLQSVDRAYQVHWKIAKNRMGPLAKGVFTFVPQFTLFTEDEVKPEGAEREALVASLMEQCEAMPYTWSDWKLRAPKEPETATALRQAVLEQAQQAMHHLAQRRWVVFFSKGDGKTTFNYGNGKTYMAQILQAQIIQEYGMPALMINWRLYTEEVKRSWKGGDIPQDWRSYPVLILDDVDTVRLVNGFGQWHAEMLYDLFEVALQRRMGVLLIMHRTPKEFATDLTAYGDVGRSAASRLMTRSGLVSVDFSRVPPWREIPRF